MHTLFIHIMTQYDSHYITQYFRSRPVTHALIPTL